MKIDRALIVPLTTALLVGIAACADVDPESETEAPATAEPAAEQSEWSYEGETGPEQWGTLSSEYESCDVGQAQSPIDIRTGEGEGDDLPSLELAYGGSDLTVEDTGHGYQATPGSDQTLTIGDQTYRVLQFHAHTPSEHTIDGQSYPMEVHFVHQNDAGELAVVGVMVEEGEPNEGYSEVVEAVRSTEQTATLDDVSSLLPSERAYYTYSGSLTTPPCTEGVRWIVLEEPITLSAEQISAWQTHGETNRPVVPVNEREVEYSG